MKTSIALPLLVVLGSLGCAAAPENEQSAGREGSEPALVPATTSEAPQPEGLPMPRRDQEQRLAVPGAPRPEAELPVAPAHIETGGEHLGHAAQALSSSEGGAMTGGATQTLYVADGSGADWLGAYPVTGAIYNAFTGNKYWVSGPSTLNYGAYDILLDLGSRMYWDCVSRRGDAVIAGYSRGVYNVLEAHRWAETWGCAPTVRAALFVDPVDTLIWGYNHVVPDNAPTRIIRKNWWYNAWAFVFANGPVYGGQQYIREAAASHPGLGSALWAADDEEEYGNWFLGTGAFLR